MKMNTFRFLTSAINSSELSWSGTCVKMADHFRVSIPETSVVQNEIFLVQSIELISNHFHTAKFIVAFLINIWDKSRK